MQRCELCNGRLVMVEFGTRCLNNNCERSKLEKKEGHLCRVCNTKLEFKRNNAYGDRSYWCSDCEKEYIL